MMASRKTKRAEEFGASALSFPALLLPLLRQRNFSAQQSKSNDYARGVPEIIPIDLSGARGHARKQIIHLREPDAEMVRNIPIKAEARRHRKRIVIDGLLAVTGVGMDEASEYLRERRKPGAAEERNFGSGHEGFGSGVHVRACDSGSVHAAGFDHPAQPAVKIQCHRCDPAVGIERRKLGAGFGMNEGIAGENVNHRSSFLGRRAHAD